MRLSSTISEKIPAQALAWYSLSIEQALNRLNTSHAGLSQNEADIRLEQFGKNALPHKAEPSYLLVFGRQFLNPLIYVLILAAIISILGNHTTDAAFIAAVIFINSFIGSVQEWKAGKSSLALQKLIEHSALVLRDRQVFELSAELLVPGDIVTLESGQHIPADLRLIEATGVAVDESHLTGESKTVTKITDAINRKDLLPSDQENMVFAGSVLIRGRLSGVVTSTGTRTAIGQLAKVITQHKAGLPPLIIRMKAFSRVITFITIGISLILILVGRHMLGLPIAELVIMAIALCVSAIPEGLPVAMTVALSVASSRMAKRNVIVRRLAAVESLGSCDYIASDKTGTLTCNQLTARKIALNNQSSFIVSGEGYIPEGHLSKENGTSTSSLEDELLQRMARAATLANEGSLHHRDHDWAWHGDPVDIALLSLAQKMHYEQQVWAEKLPRIATIPYEPDKGFAASCHLWDEKYRDGLILVLAKGAPEIIWNMCAMHEEEKKQAQNLLNELAMQSFRVIAFADGLIEKNLAEADLQKNESHFLQGLNYIGLVALLDPPRPGVAKAIAQCQKSGIRVAMVTGDHRLTAHAIAKQLGISSKEKEVVTGQQIMQAPDEKVPSVLNQALVFARVSPQQKLEIVKSVQASGHFVAVTGDGVNDAPALRVANVGVAMGRSGTDVAREAADLVIKDDHFASIVAGIEEGRIAYDNIRKVICLLISTGLAEILLVSMALLSGLPLPLLPVQLLWLNLVTNGIQDVALAFEPGEPDVLQRKPRPASEAIFNSLMNERVVASAFTMAIVSFCAFKYWIDAGIEEPEARSLTLLLMVFFEIVHIGNCRSEKLSTFQLSPLRSPLLLFGSLTALGIHFVAMYTPTLNKILDLYPVDFKTTVLVFALSLSVLFTIEFHKILWRFRLKETKSSTT